LLKRSKKVSTQWEIAQIATVSAMATNESGRMMRAIARVGGNDGLIAVPD